MTILDDIRKQHKGAQKRLPEFYRQSLLTSIQLQIGSYDFDGQTFAQIATAFSGDWSTIFGPSVSIQRRYLPGQTVAGYAPDRDTLLINIPTFTRLGNGTPLTPRDELTLAHEGVHVCNDFLKRQISTLDDEINAFIVSGIYCQKKFGDTQMSGAVGDALSELIRSRELTGSGRHAISAQELSPLRDAIQQRYGDTVSCAVLQIADGI